MFLIQLQATCGAVVCMTDCREKMRREKLSVEDGITMRTLVDFPGGLELHIGVSPGVPCLHLFLLLPR